MGDECLVGVRGFLSTRYSPGAREYGLDDLSALGSYVLLYQWRPGVNRAFCGQGSDHPAVPWPSCQCGFHAMDCSASLDRWSRKLYSGGSLQCAKWGGIYFTLVQVTGVIRAWGRVVPHEQGFRAEYAEILALSSRRKSDRDWLRPLADEFRVPVIAPDSLDLFAKEHGTTDARTFPVAEQPKATLFDSSDALLYAHAPWAIP